MPHSNCKPGNPQPPPVPQVAHPNSQGWPPNQGHSYEPEQWPKPRMPYQEVLPPEPHPQPSGPPSLSGYPVDNITPHTLHSTQYYEELYEEPPPNRSEQDEYGYGDPAKGGPNDIGNSDSQHVNGPSSVVPGPHYSTGYLPNANPHQSTGYQPDPNEPRSHNMLHNVPIPNPPEEWSTWSAYGTHEVSSIHPHLPHPLSITQPQPNPYGHGSQSYHPHAQPIDHVPPDRSNPQVNSLAYPPPPHYPGNGSYPQQGAQPNAQFPARDIQYYADGGTQHQPPQGNGYPPPRDNGNTPNYDFPSGRTTKIPGILALMPVNLLMTLVVNGSRRITMVHHIKITILHIVAPTNLISSSPMTLNQPNILGKSPGMNMRSSLTSWPPSIIRMMPLCLQSWWRAWKMLPSHFSLACLLRPETAILLFDVNLVPNLVPKKRPKLLKTNSSFFNRRMMRSLKSLLNVPYTSPHMHGEMCQQG